MSKINNLPSVNIQQNIPKPQIGKKNQKPAETQSSQVDSYTPSGPRRSEKKDWTVLCYADSGKEFARSFKHKIPELRFFKFNDKANFVIQFDQNKKTPAAEGADSQRYHLNIEGESVKFNSVSSEPAKPAKTDAINDFISWGIKNYPAKNYVVVLPEHGSVKSFSEENIRKEFAANPDLQKIISGADPDKKLDIMPGFEAFAVTSQKAQKKEPSNQANLMANTAHKAAATALETKVTADTQAEELKSFFRKNLSVKTFNGYMHAIQNENLMERAAVKELGLSLSNLIALKHYTLNGYWAINKAYTRNQKESIDALQPIIAPTIEGLDKLPSYKGNVYRTASLPADFLKQHQPGAEIQYRSFLSTSKYDGWAQKEYGEKDNVFMTIESSSKGKDVSWISECPHEDEILFPPGTSFTVLSCEKKGRRYHIHMRENSPEQGKK